MHRRVGIFLPIHEGMLVDGPNIVRSAAIVAASAVKPPVQGYIQTMGSCRNRLRPFREEEITDFKSVMCDKWRQLFMAISPYIMLEIQARSFAHELGMSHINHQSINRCFRLLRQ